MPPKLNRERAMFVLTKIDEILAWEQRKEAERDTRFVELGRYLLMLQFWLNLQTDSDDDSKLGFLAGEMLDPRSGAGPGIAAKAD